MMPRYTPNYAPYAAAATTTTTNAAPVINPEFRLACHVLLSKQTGSYNNVAFSPLCIKLLLSIAATGSNGPVCDQLRSFLQSESINNLNSVATQLLSSVFVDRSSSGGPHLSFANGVWIDKTLSLKPSFSQVLENTYKSTFSSVDFTNRVEVANEINSWVERETKGVIKNFIDSRSIQSTDLIMANTLYFKGLWRDIDIFRETGTQDGDFHLLDGGGSVKVPFMDGSHRHSAIAHHYQDFKVLSLDYKEASSEDVPRRRYTMHIFLPDEINGLPALVEKVCSDPVSLARMLPFSYIDLGKLKIPRFKISFKVEASPMLKEMGLVLPFMEGAFTEIVEERAVHISRIFQKCIIEVNEEGTKAAAATAIMYSPTSPWGIVNKPPPFDFIADHPFLFLIRERYSGTVLFIGQVLNPLDE
ncbi:serpin-ZX-like [Arachis stenosperma]|uniref:serpin-ZX-like n=1 Tax=Arachis stenosperma TaxID=217475 RepID=UPI0025AC7BB9|nr:serpin-ZX-like [Arachis stenosperma]